MRGVFIFANISAECTKRDTKLTGNVISEIPDIYDVDKCIKRCKDHGDCKAWVWLNANRCQMLKYVTGTKASVNAVSGMKNCGTIPSKYWYTHPNYLYIMK